MLETSLLRCTLECRSRQCNAEFVEVVVAMAVSAAAEAGSLHPEV